MAENMANEFAIQRSNQTFIEDRENDIALASAISGAMKSITSFTKKKSRSWQFDKSKSTN
jgi:histidinol phosphatase-like enzyme